MLHTQSIRKVKFHKDFYCVGFDTEKISKGIEDNTKLIDIDNSKPWNPGLKASSKKYYSDFNMTRKEAVKMNEDIWEFNVID